MALQRIDEQLIRRIAENAHLRLTDEEARKFSRQMADVLAAFHELDKVDTKNVKMTQHPQEMKNVWREDRAVRWRWDPLYAAKHKQKKYFKGPKIV